MRGVSLCYGIGASIVAPFSSPKRSVGGAFK